MKIKTALLFLLLLSKYGFGQQDPKCSQGFSSAAEHGKVLKEYFEKARNAGASEKQMYDSLYFTVFPVSFDEMDELFGNGYFGKYVNEGPLHIYWQDSAPGAPIRYFRDMNSIDPRVYYNKYINICVNGKWGADHIIRAFGFYNRLMYDTKTACFYLTQRNEKEIQSIFRFMFEGPHPDNSYNNEKYSALLKLLQKENSELASNLQKAYTQLLKDHADRKH